MSWKLVRVCIDLSRELGRTSIANVAPLDKKPVFPIVLFLEVLGQKVLISALRG